MRSIIYSEFLKLKRSRMLLFGALAGILPSVVKFLQYSFGKRTGSDKWAWFLASGRELPVLSMVTAVVLISCFVFAMEYQYNTAACIFTSATSRTVIYFAKVTVLLASVTALSAVAVLSDFISGYLATGEWIPSALLGICLKAAAYGMFSYFLISIIISTVVVVIKKFVISAAAVLGYIMLVFPFHMKGNAYICPFMIPAMVTARLFHSHGYIFTDYYNNVRISYFGITSFLLAISVISAVIGISCYIKRDAL